MKKPAEWRAFFMAWCGATTQASPRFAPSPLRGEGWGEGRVLAGTFLFFVPSQAKALNA